VATVLYIISKDGFQDSELFDTKGVLDDAGNSGVIASTSEGECKGSLGGTANAELSIKSALDRLDNFKAVVFVGGPGAHELKDNSDAIELAKQAFSKGKIVGAICIAPTILAIAGILKGKNATVWDGDGKQSGFITEKGAEYTGDPVTIDGKIVTANGPNAANAFGEALVKVITES
jgi:protease I